MGDLTPYCPFYLGCAVITDALRHGLPPTRDIVTCTKQGHEIWLSVTSIVVPSVCEAFTVLIHLFRDVTRYHELMQAATGLANLASGLSSPDVRRLSIVPRPEDSGKLTVREREVLALLATGLSTKEIARRLFISPRTAGNHINNILGKLGVHSRLDAVVYAVRNGLV